MASLNRVGPASAATGRVRRCRHSAGRVDDPRQPRDGQGRRGRSAGFAGRTAGSSLGSSRAGRPPVIADAFVELADTLVDDFDVLDFLHTLVERAVGLLDADAGGIMLADGRGGLEVLAASSHEVQLVELFELQNQEGPCLEAFRSGRAVTKDDLAEMRAAWPSFTARLEQAGFSSAQAIPMRLRERVIGALNVFRITPGALGSADMNWPGRSPTSPPWACSRSAVSARGTGWPGNCRSR